MRYLLDTATWANGVLKPAVIPRKIRQLLGGDERKGICSVTLLEVAIHHRLGRLMERQANLQDFFNRGLSADIEVIELSPAIAVATNDLPANFPGDPFDRTIAATARVLTLTLITSDREIRNAGFCKVEFYPFRPSRA